MKKLVVMVAVIAIALAGMVSMASAHSISIGFENAGPGSVNIWLGTYSVGHGYQNEGSMQLDGALGTVYGPTVQTFNMLTPIGVGNKPAGLIDGTTNFFSMGPGTTTLANTDATFTSLCPRCGPITRWQGTTFTGLSAGDYQFNWIPAASPTMEWSPWSNSLNGVFNLAGVVNPPSTVPEPGTIILLGSGLLGLVYFRRKRA